MNTKNANPLIHYNSDSMKNKKLWISLILLFTILIITQTMNFPSWGGDTTYPNFTFNNLHNYFYIWSDHFLSGYASNSNNLILLTFFTILDQAVGSLSLYQIYLTLVYLYGAFGMFFLCSYFLKEETPFLKYTISILATCFFIIPLSVLYVPAMFLPFAFLCLIKFLRSLETKPDYLFLAFSVGAFTLFLGFTGDAFLLPAMIFFTLTLIIFTYTSKKNLRNKIIKFILLIYTLAFLINLPWILSTLFIVHASTSGVYAAQDATIITCCSYNLVKAIISFNERNWILGLITAALIEIGLYGLLKNKYLLPSHKSLIVLIVVSFIFFIPLQMLGSKLLYPLIVVFPFLLALRGANVTIPFIYVFIVPLIFAFGSIYVMKRLRSEKVKRIWIALLFLITLTYIITNYSIRTPSTPIAPIPNAVTSISNFINTQPGSFTVATLPAANDWITTESYQGVDLYSVFINKPVYTGGYTAQSSVPVSYPPSQYEYSYYVAAPIDFGIPEQNLSNVFGVLGIEYIIVQGQAINCPYCHTQVFSFPSIYGALNSSQSITFIKTYGSDKLYQNKNYDPLFYPSGIVYMGKSSIYEVFNEIENSNIDIQRYSFYSKVMQGGPINSNLSINAPNLTYIERSPVSLQVHVQNATTPYYLIFRETFDQNWQARYQNGSIIPLHSEVNGFANAWYVNQTGNYTIDITYTLQKYETASFYIMAIVIMGILGLICYFLISRYFPSTL